jgi:NADPH2:quinone reductase
LSKVLCFEGLSIHACRLTPGGESGAGFHVGYLTAYHALKQRGELRPGETLLVVGAAGGMGVAAVQIGKVWSTPTHAHTHHCVLISHWSQLLGATVIAAASGPAKAAALRQLGADHVVDYATESLRDRAMVCSVCRGYVCADVLRRKSPKAAAVM